MMGACARESGPLAARMTGPNSAQKEEEEMTTTVTKLRTAWGAILRSERGDVPGWVLITLMTAGLVALIWALAGPALAALFEQALTRVSGF